MTRMACFKYLNVKVQELKHRNYQAYTLDGGEQCWKTFLLPLAALWLSNNSSYI